MEEMPETGMVFDVTWSVTSALKVLTFISVVTSSAVEFCRAFSLLRIFRELQGCVCLGLLSLNPIYSRLGMGIPPVPTTSKLALSEQWEAPMK